MKKDGRPISQNGTEEVTCSVNEAEILKFDLAEDIMAEQRKNTAIRRKAPDKKIDSHSQGRPDYGPLRRDKQVESIDYTIGQPIPSGQDRIISEIVARDIKRLCQDREK